MQRMSKRKRERERERESQREREEKDIKKLYMFHPQSGSTLVPLALPRRVH